MKVALTVVVVALSVCMPASIPGRATAQGVPEPAGNRVQDYRAPVPDTLHGARVIGAEAAHDLWQSGAAAFVDVLPRPTRLENLPEGTLWIDRPRLSIPGALWLPNVGYGAISEETATYFRRGLKAATGGDKDRPVVIFCLAECWMSWNAAKRALKLVHPASCGCPTARMPGLRTAIPQTR